MLAHLSNQTTTIQTVPFLTSWNTCRNTSTNGQSWTPSHAASVRKELLGPKAPCVGVNPQGREHQWSGSLRQGVWDWPGWTASHTEIVSSTLDSHSVADIWTQLELYWQVKGEKSFAVQQISLEKLYLGEGEAGYHPAGTSCKQTLTFLGGGFCPLSKASRVSPRMTLSFCEVKWVN